MIRFFVVFTGLLLLFFASVQVSRGNVPDFLLSDKANRAQKTQPLAEKQADVLPEITTPQTEEVKEDPAPAPISESPKKSEPTLPVLSIPTPSQKTEPMVIQPTQSAPVKNVSPASSSPAAIIEEVPKQVSVPKPITQNKFANDLGELDATVVINLTNKARAQNGLPPLLRMYKLDNSAKIKALDMLAKQYFAHDSPTGVTVEDLAVEVQYEFVSLGENLAYGNFASDQELVDGWMNSPGHRANILSKKYTEIGVSVVRGVYQGNEVWMAVQEFGKPRSACPEPNVATKEQVEMTNKKIETLSDMINDKKKALSLKDPADPTYNQDVDEINALVAEHNQLVAQVKLWISEYNKTVAEFNACASS